MEDEKGHGPQYPAHGGAKITGDRPRGLETQGATRDSATCDPVPGVQAQGTLGSGATCAKSPTSDDPGDWRSEPSRQFAAMTQPTSRREKRRVAHMATKDAIRGKHGTLNPVAVAAGRSSTDDRMDVAQSSASESDSIYAGSTGQGSEDEDTLHFSPSQEMGAEAGPSSSCSARVTAGGAAAGVKRKTEGGPTPPQAAKKKPKRGPSLGHTFKQAQEEDLLGVVMIKDHPYTTLARTHVDWIRRQLLVKLEEAIDAGGTAPTFQESGVRQNRFHLSCTNRESYAWLRATIGSMVAQGEGHELPLQLVPASEVPKLLRAEVYISGPPPGAPKFLKLVQAQNKGLQTGGFSGISRLQTGVS